MASGTPLALSDAAVPAYRGRFALTPSGPLHFGSLVTAVASYLEANRHGGRWLVRMEDLDPPRVLAGAADEILRTLEAFGFEWEGAVLFQSTRTAAYQRAFEQLRADGHVYGCRCPQGMREGSRCVARCREGIPAGAEVRSWRVDDVVVLRADGVFAYNLAVVVDYAEQGITHVVLGADLVGVTPSQILLQQLLGYRAPNYLHLPLARDEHGEKLSKQTRAPALTGAPFELVAALRFLGQPVPPELDRTDEIWAWATVQAATDCCMRAGTALGIPNKKP
jgi:glutamyl-Q tRNA(Asp) synthetase